MFTHGPIRPQPPPATPSHAAPIVCSARVAGVDIGSVVEEARAARTRSHTAHPTTVHHTTHRTAHHSAPVKENRDETVTLETQLPTHAAQQESERE